MTATPAAAALTARERDVLDLESSFRFTPGTGAKERTIHTLLGGMSAARYYQILAGLTARPEALAYAPATIHRLQARMTVRSRSRGRTFA